MLLRSPKLLVVVLPHLEIVGVKKPGSGDWLALAGDAPLNYPSATGVLRASP